MAGPTQRPSFGAYIELEDADGAIVVIRCLMIGAIALCGNQYKRLETRRLERSGASVPEAAPAAPIHAAPEPAHSPFTTNQV